MFSGSVTSDIEAVANGMSTSQITFLKPSVEYTSMMGSGFFKADELSLISHITDSYMLYRNIETSGLIPEEAMAVLKEYE